MSAGADRGLVGRDPASGRALEVRVADGVVSAIGEVGDGQGADLPWLTPGLIDLQVNGYAGHDVNGPDVSAEAVVELTRALARAGTTTYVPTVTTASEEDMTRSLRAIAQAREADPRTRAAVPYAHVEGPHLSEQDGPRGAHPLEHVRPPDPEEYARWQAACGGLIGMITLSPHFPGAAAYTRAVTGDGVHVAVGHTHADGEQIAAVVDAGAVLSTHLGNGAHATLPRHPNYIWAQLAQDRLTASVIADGHHLPGDTMTAIIRAKGPGRSLLVSDSVALAGLEPGRYTAPVGGEVELSADGRLAVAGTPYLAGAARSLADGVAGVCRLTGCGVADAVAMATEAPARFLPEVWRARGSLTVGSPADLLLFDLRPGDEHLTIREVLVGGRQAR